MRAVGGSVQIDPPTTPSFVVRLMDAERGRCGLGRRCAAAAAGASCTSAARTSPTDGMKHLAGLRMLQKLDLFDTQIGDAGLANLSGYRLATALAPRPSPERRGEIIALTPEPSPGGRGEAGLTTLRD